MLVAWHHSRWRRPVGAGTLLVMLAITAMVSSCGQGARNWSGQTGAASTAGAWASVTVSLPPPSTLTTPTPATTSTPTPPPTATSTPTAYPAGTSPACQTPRSTSGGKPSTLEQYLARIPCFGPAPPAVPVVFPKGPVAEFLYEIPTKQKVAFITIDDGITRHPWAAQMIREAGVPVTLFLTTNYVKGHTGYFRELLDSGLVEIQGHTVSHPDLRTLSYSQQKYQLCHASDLLADWFKSRPVLFRPPYGEIDPDRQNPETSPTMKAAWSCHLLAGFYWRETVDKGKVRYQAGSTVRPGDILLMHFRPAFPDDFLAALNAIKKAGLTPALLSDYISGSDAA